MNNSMSSFVRGLILLILFIAGVTLVILGQQNIGAPGLGTMLLGLAMLVSALWFYNRKYK